MLHGLAVHSCKSLKRKENACRRLQHELQQGDCLNCLILLERAMGIEPTTLSLGS
jgi:hypothetical protein